MSKVLVKITAEVIDGDSLKTLGKFHNMNVIDLNPSDHIARAIDLALEIADDATKWEQVD